MPRTVPERRREAWLGLAIADRGLPELRLSLALEAVLDEARDHHDLEQFVGAFADAGEERIAQVASAVPGALGSHAIRTRGTDAHEYVDLHVQVDPGLSVSEAHGIAEQVEKAIFDGFEEVADVIAHVEPFDDHQREKTASGMGVRGTPVSRAACTVHLPVPFWPALSTIMSTRGTPSAPCRARMAAAASV